MILSMNFLNQLIYSNQIGRVTITSFIPGTGSVESYISSPFLGTVHTVHPNDQFIRLINAGTNEFNQMIQSPRLTKENYMTLLINFKGFIQRTGLEISFRDDEALYEEYKLTQETSPALGIVNVIDSGYERIGIGDSLKIHLPGASGFRLGVDSFAKMLSFLYPKLDLTVSNVVAMYKNYARVNSYLETDPVSANPIFASANSIEDVYNFMDQIMYSYIGKELSEIEIRALVKGEVSDQVLSNYYRYFATSFGLRETTAREMLLYTKNIRLVHAAIREENMGISRINRRVLFEEILTATPSSDITYRFIM